MRAATRDNLNGGDHVKSTILSILLALCIVGWVVDHLRLARRADEFEQAFKAVLQLRDDRTLEMIERDLAKDLAAFEVSTTMSGKRFETDGERVDWR